MIFLANKKLEKKKDSQLASIRSNHDIEYKNSIFFKYCVSHGINRNFSTSKTPQQNGVVKRKIGL